jgi:hypothetical protein
MDKTVYERGLVTENIKSADIRLNEAAYYRATDVRNFTNDVLGYVTPVCIIHSLNANMVFRFICFFNISK